MWDSYLRILLGTTALGLAAGAIGPALLLRRQTLVADAIAHSSLPGIAGPFLLCSAAGLDPRNPLALMLGAGVAGYLAVAIIQAPRRPLHSDAVMAATLATFFSLGIIMLRFISRAPLPGKAGIGDYLLGNASTLTRADVRTIIVVGAGCVLLLSLVHPRHVASVFDPMLFRHRGVDALCAAVLVALTVVGIKVMGVVLMVSIFIAPAVAARRLSRRVLPFIVLSALCGGVGAAAGTAASIYFSVPTGPAIVVTDALLALPFLWRKP